MEINLKKALRLRKELEATVNKFDLPLSVPVSVLVVSNVTDASPLINEARNQLQKRCEDFTFLSAFLATLRFNIAAANVSCGVEGLLASIAEHDRAMGLLRRLVVAPVTPAQEEFQTDIAMAYGDLQNTETRRNAYGTPAKTVTIAVMAAENAIQTQSELARLKRVREELEDQRTGLNASTKITIADEDADRLRAFGLL